MQIIGSGLLANSFVSKRMFLPNNVIVFASGVSNSEETMAKNFQRERYMLSLLPHDAKIVYFSSCSIQAIDKINTPYVRHKSSIEVDLLSRKIEPLIVRLPQVVGSGGNPKNLLNFLSKSILNNLRFSVQGNAFRNLIDVQDVVSTVLELLSLNANGVINVANPLNIKVIDIVKLLELVLNKKANYNVVDRGEGVNVDISETIKIIPSYTTLFEDDYSFKLIFKYFSVQ